MLSSLAVLAFSASLATAYEPRAMNGMDMSMDDGMSMANGTMLPMLHFSLGDTLFFQGWVPQTRAALFGACVGLFLLALVDRWLAAVRSMAEASWRRSRVAAADCDDKNKKRRVQLQAPPFVLAHDLTRGALHALQSAIGFVFMLAVMTFQAAYIITIIGGLGVGEALFGRYHAAANGAH
ncbi:CTR copper uptake transporter [Mycena kentingensis (nom. inval.)]|nr:CTR copper uptake transporter [Mycena kentingensis (nom. inval.)]